MAAKKTKKKAKTRATAKKKKKTAAKKGAAKKKSGAKKGGAKKGGAKKGAAKKGAAKKSAAKKGAPQKGGAKKGAAKNGSETGYGITALPAKRPLIDVSSAYKGDNLDHHPVSRRDLEEVRNEGLRGDGEILHVEESEFAPCRLVDHGEGRFSLCFDDFRMPQDVPLFKERGLQGGGYTWEAVVASLVKQKRPELEAALTYDSEAGMFVALGDRESLQAVAGLIQGAIADPAVLRDALDGADPDRLE